MAGDANEYACVRPLQSARRDAGILDRFPSRFQQPALLRIHARRFARRDTPKTSVEIFNTVDKATPFGDHLVGNVPVGMVVVIAIPTRFGDFDNPRATIDKQIPKAFDIKHTAWQATSHAHDR
jgi:hypothetical protein